MIYTIIFIIGLVTVVCLSFSLSFVVAKWYIKNIKKYFRNTLMQEIRKDLFVDAQAEYCRTIKEVNKIVHYHRNWVESNIKELKDK